MLCPVLLFRGCDILVQYIIEKTSIPSWKCDFTLTGLITSTTIQKVVASYLLVMMIQTKTKTKPRLLTFFLDSLLLACCWTTTRQQLLPLLMMITRSMTTMIMMIGMHCYWRNSSSFEDCHYHCYLHLCGKCPHYLKTTTTKQIWLPSAS